MQLLIGSEAYDMSQYAPNSANEAHLMTELMRRVYADRATWLGDSDFVKVPIRQLLDADYIRQRNATINLEKATPSIEVKQGEVERIESYETTHFSIVDRWGNAAAITTTLNSRFGSKLYVPDAGCFLNNEMDDFSAKPGVANQFGLVGSEANAIEGGKRMLSSMSPTLCDEGGKTPFRARYARRIHYHHQCVSDAHQCDGARNVHSGGRRRSQDSCAVVTRSHQL